jgi:hypothetical protein
LTALRAVGLFGLLAWTANQAVAAEPSQHTVAWYQAHQKDRENVLQACQNDHALNTKADCRNAFSASHGAAADTFAGAAAGKTDPEADPAYYGHNGPLIAMTLSMCSRNSAPQSWCQAARTASANLPK